MLTAVRLKDFKNHIDTEIQLGRLTCLAGPNGCGKTSVLEAIHFAAQTLRLGASSLVTETFRIADLPRRSISHFQVGIELVGKNNPPETDDEVLEIELHSRKAGNFSKRASADNVEISGKWRHIKRSVTSVLMKWRDIECDDEKSGYRVIDALAILPWNLGGEFALLIPCSYLLSPQIEALRRPSCADLAIPSMSPEASNLPSVIAYLITAEPDRFRLLMERLRDVLPRIERLRTQPVRVAINEPAEVSTKGKTIYYKETREYPGHELLFDLKDAPGIPARAVSEGTLLVTALLTATVWNQGANLLLIDDLEKGLHPKAQRELVAALKRLLELEPEMQIVFSTHSPYIIDELEADQVWIMVADDERGVIARRLSDHPRAEEALQVLTTGEFLDAEGEDWVRDMPAAS
jgi:ABC-type branched-subunit amino acid transport system ATPase component